MDKTMHLKFMSLPLERPTRIKLSRGWITKAREIYSTSRQLCGVRGNIKAPAEALFWQPRKSLTFILTFESEQEHNPVITLTRKYDFDCNIYGIYLTGLLISAGYTAWAR
ncbi:unnamed protein product [Brassica rapa]|uniref:Stomatal closure-related actin-binding protein PH domain-containing protein n=1 Tax=Brassica campestris TaxID=3711 RepID=A0A3P6CDZ0_BRACM|nr:unnamed protein product [Brassica rapa]VDD13626.1 unnamed protein product [Brassica rapa]